MILQNRQNSYRFFKFISIFISYHKFLPYEGFKWLKNGNNSDANLISKQSPIGYILKIDLEYPDELHKLHNDYPLSPEKLAIPYDILSDYCKKLLTSTE